METPLAADASFVVLEHQLQETLFYYYFDPENNYQKFKENGVLDSVLLEVRENLQKYISEDRVFMNDTEIELHVDEVILDFKDRNPAYPILIFYIYSDPYELEIGKNVLTLDAKVETAPYECSAEWLFPGKVLEVKTRMHATIKDNYVYLKSYEGEPLGGLENFFFEYKKQKLEYIEK